ncbi:MAG: threonine synthase [Euryarchaeota archaeon]|jgi:threonine synthase|nr:threonine synthase [Euryarchaeota archaeon]MBT3654060.1 threonine synthase [Euryarchaeota archaeon]MBT3757706.1 threonine synthase [Euryarchaeota archaeon]MBT4050498.1 threonine synthase [Euryarchaeota archaeon]MBT4346949.1 threonine synthase [Euryarchaeota archaeon]
MTATYVSKLECAYTGEEVEKNIPQTLSPAGKPILVKYDLEAIGNNISRLDIENSEDPGFWRYAPLLPVSKAENRVSLGEVITPLITLKNSVKDLDSLPGVVVVKDESRLPTGSFKARGLALAVSMAKEFGFDHLSIPTNGNAGSALAAYAARAGMKSTILCPDDTPEINTSETLTQGGDTYLVNGLIGDCGKIIGEGKEKLGWFAVSTLKEPYRIEGKKTMGLELAEQLGWNLPDVIFYPTGGGTGLIGMWKAFHELKELGWIDCKFPKMVAVQSTGCAPIVKAWEDGVEHAEFWENADTEAAGIRVPSAIGDFLIIRAIKESNGFAIAIDDEDIIAARNKIGREDGLLMCPEGAATFAAYEQSLKLGLVKKEDNVILFNTATGLKYPLPKVTKTIDKNNKFNEENFR